LTQSSPSVAPRKTSGDESSGISQRRFFLLLGLFFLSLLVQLIAFKSRIEPYDEFLSLYGAERVLHGGVPYRDFWTMYGPAQFYLLAAFLKVFGISVLAGRLYDALIRAAIACACFVLVRLMAPLRWALAAFAMVLLWLACIYYPAYNYPVYPGLLASLISCLFFARYLQDLRLSSLFLSGLLVSIATIFRHDSGFYICIAELLMLAWTTFHETNLSENRFAVLLRRLLPYFIGVALLAVQLYGFVLWKAGFRNLFYDLFYVPGVIYPKFRSLPLVTQEDLYNLHHPLSWDGRLAVESLIVFFPLFVILSSALCLLASSRSRLFAAPWQRQTFLLLLLLASLFFLKGLIRPGPVQMIQSIVIGLVLLAILFGHLPQLSRLQTASLYAGALYLVFCTLPVLTHLIGFARVNFANLIHPGSEDSFAHRCHPPAALNRARCLLVTSDVTSAIEEIERRSSPAQPIYVGDGRHDRIFWNDVRLYFLSGRSSITRWYDLHPGVQTTLPIQNQIIDALRRKDPPLVVLNSTWDDAIEPNQSRYSSGVTALDDYIRAHYNPQARFGEITILTPAQNR